MSKLVANILCHNDLVYMMNLIPLVQKFCDTIIVVDDCSTDGSREYLKMQYKVVLVERKFDFDFAAQRNVALDMVDNGDWVFRIDSDEVPSDDVINYLQNILPYFNARSYDRIIIPIFHMVNLNMCKTELGVEMRLFVKNPTCIYLNKTHEHLHGEFPKDHAIATFPENYSLIHWKYADKNKVSYTKDVFIENEIYNDDDLKRRLNMDSTFLPPVVRYSLTNSLKEYLCTNNSSQEKV